MPKSRRVAAAVLALVLGGSVPNAHGYPATSSAPTESPRTDAIARGRDLFLHTRYDEALQVFLKRAEDAPNDPDPLAWISLVQRRLGNKPQSAAYARKALALAPCHALAHVGLSEVMNPQYGEWAESNADSSWTHALRAVACDSSMGMAWLTIWLESLRRGDRDLEFRSLHALDRIGFFTPSVYVFTRWIFAALPDSAILIVNGDIDTYPEVIQQGVHGVRTDVAIVNISLLETDWYRRVVRDRYGVRMPFEAAAMDSLDSVVEGGASATPGCRVVRGWLGMMAAGDLHRPLCVAITVSDPCLTEEVLNQMTLHGPYFEVHPEAATSRIDTTEVRRSLTALVPGEFHGPAVSLQDLSPTRASSADVCLGNVLYAAYVCYMVERATGQDRKANEIHQWAEGFAKQAENGHERSDTVR
jgi:hypothetical protein